jgi:hypothetical protein
MIRDSRSWSLGVGWEPVRYDTINTYKANSSTGILNLCPTPKLLTLKIGTHVTMIKIVSKELVDSTTVPLLDLQTVT